MSLGARTGARAAASPPKGGGKATTPGHLVPPRQDRPDELSRSSTIPRFRFDCARAAAAA